MTTAGRGLGDLFRAMSDPLYQPKAHIPDHLLAAARRPMNGRDAARLLAQAPVIAKVIDPMEMFKCPPLPSAN